MPNMNRVLVDDGRSAAQSRRRCRPQRCAGLTHSPIGRQPHVQSAHPDDAALGIQAGHLQLFHVKHCRRRPASAASSSAGCLALHGHPDALRRQRADDQRTKSASDAKAREHDHVERLGPQLSTRACSRCRLGSFSVGRRLLDEGGFLGHRVDAGHVHVRAADRRSPRPAGRRRSRHRAARTCAGRCRWRSQRRERPPGCRAGDASASLPGRAPRSGCRPGSILHQVQVGQQLVDLLRSLRSSCSACQAGAQACASQIAARSQACRRLRPVRTRRSARRRACFCTGFFFRCTSSSEIAAGVMPEMREARPSVSGRCLASFWRASKRQRRDLAVVQVRRQLQVLVVRARARPRRFAGRCSRRTWRRSRPARSPHPPAWRPTRPRNVSRETSGAMPALRATSATSARRSPRRAGAAGRPGCIRAPSPCPAPARLRPPAGCAG